MKKGFISIYTLIIFLILSLTITFIYTQNENTNEYINDLYNKKQAQYLAESILNIYIDSNYEKIKNEILKDNEYYKNEDRKSYWVSEDGKVSYNGNTYYLKIAYVKRNDDPKLSDVYRIETSKINVGDSVASAQAIFKFIDSKEQLDKKDIKLMAKYTY